MAFEFSFFNIVSFLLGLHLGSYLRDFRWIEKSKDGTRMECRGKLYNVTLDR